MGEATANRFDEPFGQTGVRKFLRPLFLLICGACFCLCALALGRSFNNYDRFERTSDGQTYVVGSAIDRLLITIEKTPIGLPDSAGWNFSSTPLVNVEDRWAPSWRKTIGVEWGEETNWFGGMGSRTFWRLRVRWRTLMAIYLLPLAWEVVRRRLTRRRVSPAPLAASPLT